MTSAACLCQVLYLLNRRADLTPLTSRASNQLVGRGTSKYRVVGDTYIEGIMFGEARTWKESEADDIILV